MLLISNQKSNQTKRDFDVDPGCFVAGTLVHTKEGLVPIEKISVGDWVLSKHESGQGEREYKRVTKTFEHLDQEIMGVRYSGAWRRSSGRRGAHHVESPVLR